MKELWRLGKIIRIFAKHGFGDIAERLFRKAEKEPVDQRQKEWTVKNGFPSPQRIRCVLEELGPSFIKLGQLMSTRADIFPSEYIEEFTKLQDQVPPVPFSNIKRVIEQELRRPLEEIFEEFTPKSMAAASVAQVHLAELFSGEEIAVKIIRPNIDKEIRKDIRLMYSMAKRAEKISEIARVIGAVNLVKEFERVIFKELDMFIEAGNIEKFANNFKSDDEIYIPKVYWDYTTKSVLTMEHIPGIKMDQVDDISAHGIDPKDIAMIGLRSFSRQLMDFGLFHADPHSGNTIVMFDGRVSLVDFGITGYLDDETMHQIAYLLLGYAEHDYEMVMDALLAAGLIDEETMDLKSFRTDLKDVSESFYGRSLQTISVRDVYDQIIQLIYKYKIRLPRNLLLLFKTFIQTEALGKILGSDASILEVTKPYAQKLIERSYQRKNVLKTMRKDAISMGSRMKWIPKLVHDILHQTAKGKQRIELQHNGFQDMSRQFVKGINRLIIGLVISASLIAGAMVLNASQKLFVFTVNFFGGQKISLTALLGVTGYVVASFLGIWLIIMIFRSRKL
ncbi:MAG: AarF/ABC1/UbiB kinase family protein [Thermodesulfobacteriota bacterium]|nr:AarF/ABC1/UbiB kinase family protein [Thermodesulfobacteriota bacterium]